MSSITENHYFFCKLIRSKNIGKHRFRKHSMIILTYAYVKHGSLQKKRRGENVVLKGNFGFIGQF